MSFHQLLGSGYISTQRDKCMIRRPCTKVHQWETKWEPENIEVHWSIVLSDPPSPEYFNVHQDTDGTQQPTISSRSVTYTSLDDSISHYIDVIMTTMASQITSLTVVYSIVYSDADRVTGHFAGNSPGTGEFPAEMASYVENVSIWWRHHEFWFQSCWDWLLCIHIVCSNVDWCRRVLVLECLQVESNHENCDEDSIGDGHDDDDVGWIPIHG